MQVIVWWKVTGTVIGRELPTWSPRITSIPKESFGLELVDSPMVDGVKLASAKLLRYVDIE